LLDARQTTDLSVSTAAETWTGVGGGTFTVTEPTAEIIVSVRGFGKFEGGTTLYTSSILIDGTTRYQIGSTQAVDSNVYAGTNSVAVGTLSSGSHTIDVEVLSHTISGYFCRPASQETEFLAIQVWQLA
jgi:hypothetical protein